MTYVIVTLHAPDPTYREIFISLLDGIGYDGFEEAEAELKAYIPEQQYDADKLSEIIHAYALEDYIQVSSIAIMPDQNWNALWESNFQPVVIDDKVVVKAPFHQTPAYHYEIIIEPKMAFGTGHHETTAMMIKQMLNFPMRGAQVLDFGCGTGILAIMAAKLGARHITAIDNDPAATQNTLENIDINQCSSQVTTLQGDHTAIPINEHYHIILANINRNVILDALPMLCTSLLPDAALLLSGILRSDVADIKYAAQEQQLRFANELHDGNWAMLHYQK